MVALTLALVGVTAWYALQTRRLVVTTELTTNRAAEAARAAQRSAMAAELSLRIQNLPVVIPQLVESAQLGRQLVIKNVGNAPAINVEASIEPHNGTPAWARTVTHILEPTVAEISLPLEPAAVPLASDVRALIGIHYEDPSGHRYRFEHPYQGTFRARLLRWDEQSWVPFLPE